MSIGLTVAEPERDRREGLEAGRLLGYAEGVGHLDDLLRAVLHRGGQVDVGGVHRVLGRGEQADGRAVALALALTLVADLPAAVGQHERRVAVEGVLEREPVLEPGCQRERLERGAG